MLQSAAMDTESPLAGAVREHYLFAGLADDVFETLARQMTLVELDKGDVLFHRGDPYTHFYFVDTGLIELSLVSQTGEKKTLEIVDARRTFAEAVAFMRERRYPVTAEALETTTLCRIPTAPYLDTLQGNPDACLRLLADISRHLHARVREIENLTVQNARSRLISYLLDHIDETTGDDEATVRLTMPRHVIASRLSIKPETLSRLLRALTDEGLVSIEDRLVFIHRLSGLRLYD